MLLYIYISIAAIIAVAGGALFRTPYSETVTSEKYNDNPQYSYGYNIQDSITGDSKIHVESRNGDVVQGFYSLIEPDGTRRIVHYVADPINGFKAQVHKEAIPGKSVVGTPIIGKFAIASNGLDHTVPFALPIVYSSSTLH